MTPDALGPDEAACVAYLRAQGVPAEVVATCAARLAAGATTYGPLELDADPRAFDRELAEECLDALNYLAMDAVRRARRGHAAPPAEMCVAVLSLLALDGT